MNISQIFSLKKEAINCHCHLFYAHELQSRSNTSSKQKKRRKRKIGRGGEKSLLIMIWFCYYLSNLVYSITFFIIEKYEKKKEISPHNWSSYSNISNFTWDNSKILISSQKTWLCITKLHNSSGKLYQLLRINLRNLLELQNMILTKASLNKTTLSFSFHCLCIRDFIAIIFVSRKNNCLKIVLSLSMTNLAIVFFIFTDHVRKKATKCQVSISKCIWK